VPLTFIDGKKSYTVSKAFEGVIGNLNRRMLQTESAWMREELGKFQTAQPCETCNGARLKPEALSVKVAGSDISATTRLSVSDALEWFATLDGKLTSQQSQIAKAILKEINERLGFLNNVGLDYLNLDRTSGTLGRGIAAHPPGQPDRLGPSGVLYVLDEPSIGLHQRDNDRLLETLKRLRDLGNTVIVVEHDEDAIRAADWIVDLGPGAGVHGGTSSPRARWKTFSATRTASPANTSPARAASKCPRSAARATARAWWSKARGPTTSRT
jgi:excinuclease ABC subunit A